ncbi:MAG: radical SAM protein [Chloroflexi bacterium]|nr:radical SAM protein [Chloroflexota bacterium]
MRVALHGHAIRFDRPSLTLPVSLTGTHCALNCKHCGGHYLRHMHAIDDPRASEMKSCLISGGCDPHGRVPVESQLTAVAQLHTHLRLNWHVGMIAEDTMRAIAPYVDVVSFDVVGDAETTREVYGLDLDLEDYLIELAMLQRYARVVPHVTIGLRGGRLSGEDCALDALAAAPLDALILNVLIPTPGTSYAECSPPPLEQVARLFVKTRLLMPTARLVLGCMRPLGQYRQALDALAVRAGLNGIVNPTQRAQRVAAELGLQVTWGQECCAF